MHDQPVGMASQAIYPTRRESPPKTVETVVKALDLLTEEAEKELEKLYELKNFLIDSDAEDIPQALVDQLWSSYAYHLQRYEETLG